MSLYLNIKKKEVKTLGTKGFSVYTISFDTMILIIITVISQRSINWISDVTVDKYHRIWCRHHSKRIKYEISVMFYMIRLILIHLSCEL